MKILRRFGQFLLGLVVALGIYALYAGWAYHDLPAAELEQKYGGTDLQTADLDGVPVRYRLEGSGPTVVLVHSHYFEMGMWDGWMPELTRYFRVLRYDLTGHGLTGPDPSGIYTVDRDVALLEGLLQKLALDKVAVVGSSLGGNIAFTLAARDPQRVTHLVLVNSGGLKRDKARSGKGIPAWAGSVMRRLPDTLWLKFLRWMIADDRVINDALQTRFLELWKREGNRDAEIGRLRQFEPGDPDTLLAQITAPTLILWGGKNPQLPAALSEQFAQKLTHAARVQRKIYLGAGHVLPVEAPQASALDTVAFLLNPDSGPQP